MQLLFQPPPAIVLSEDAITHCDTVTYYASKLALGDACRLSSSAGKNMTSKSSSDQDLLQVIEGFIDRSKRLADNFKRLEKGKSLILEVMMDSQDLEKVSFINRFAKFHARRPTVTGDRSSSTMRKLYPQRYVKAIPMPKMVPEGQNCLFL
ncbi:hypothetical protein L1987_24591 [Smallanthus sonchifolius]|uniref:Uncharacterized protein n=1 Tax=Smallanthus sonchifolius TaxID=185202 RepID=A0ACB9IKT7_9ASTR|nr:hypothetical protein L1987_24591 [Smallanthus sonchifolius]